MLTASLLSLVTTAATTSSLLSLKQKETKTYSRLWHQLKTSNVGRAKICEKEKYGIMDKVQFDSYRNAIQYTLHIVGWLARLDELTLYNLPNQRRRRPIRRKMKQKKKLSINFISTSRWRHQFYLQYAWNLRKFQRYTLTNLIKLISERYGAHVRVSCNDSCYKTLCYFSTYSRCAINAHTVRLGDDDGGLSLKHTN